ncbi:winged helix-turn-helix domain-containing protein [Colwellia piezophila]|uniref:winged helix-turn-helix domain-containing protein n=1 Tax=Colwellia piezophila TaxID=211668 RepID=UPI0003610EF9|nr:winged helix-turn-helix domain-containing protein [Colwellia piezophila]
MSLGDQFCEINTTTGELLFNGNTTVLRPKTFQLFLLLASKPERIFSKSEILASVWQGTVVEDQVIFQSINEIRKELGNAEVIKTYPRRGYSTGVPIKIVDHLTVNTAKSITRPKPMHLQKFIIPCLVTLLILVGSALTYFVSTTNSVKPKELSLKSPSLLNNTLAHKGILVLPFDVSSLTDSQQWLRYGAMEGVIKKILPNNSVTIFHLEDVIEILNRIPVGKRQNINNIFALSGASYVLETSVGGTPGEWIFVYTIYSRTDRTTKTIHARSHDEAFTQIVKSLEQSLDETLAYDAGKFDKQLQNDLISKAVQFLEVDDYESALTFINGALISEPNNMTALYLLVKTKLNLNEAQDALNAINKALSLIEKDSDLQYEPRLLLFKGMALASMGKVAQAEDNILAANKLSRTKKDWLYYAYSQSMLGKLSQNQQRYDRAFELFSSALEYQELLNCPLGITQGYIDFAYYYLAIGKTEQAKKNANKAKVLIQEKNLIKALPLLKKLEGKMSSL